MLTWEQKKEIALEVLREARQCFRPSEKFSKKESLEFWRVSKRIKATPACPKCGKPTRFESIGDIPMDYTKIFTYRCKDVKYCDGKAYLYESTPEPVCNICGKVLPLIETDDGVKYGDCKEEHTDEQIKAACNW